MHRRLGAVEKDQLLQVEMTQLATDLTADGSGGARHHHDLAFQGAADLTQIDLDLLATQQVVDTDFRKMTEAEGGVFNLVDSRRHHQHANLQLLAIADKALALHAQIFAVEKKNGFDIVMNGQ